jgi:penicillin-binding protein 1A
VTTLLRLTTGYAEFVNGGRKLEATLIDRVQDRHGKTVYRFDKRTCPDCSQADWRGQEEPLLDENQQQVLDPRTAYQVVSILEGVIQRGTGAAIRVLGKPLAGKTGTSSDFRDAGLRISPTRARLIGKTPEPREGAGRLPRRFSAIS